MRGRLIFLVLLAVSASCGKTDAPGREPHTYADVRGFFISETSRLNKLDQKVDKIVSRNEVSERKENIRPDWEIELSLFMESDINKPAWNKSYSIIETDSTVSYSALDPALRTRRINIRKNKSGGFQEIHIENESRNMLYVSSEELRYMRDSIYRIVKHQDVIVLGSNTYQITGLLK